MNRPLVVVVLFYAVGLLLGQLSQPSFQPPLSALFAASFLLLLCALVFKTLRPFLLWPLLVLVGGTNLVFHTAVISPRDLRSLLGHEPTLATIRGNLAEMPRIKMIERGDQETEHSLTEVNITALKTDNHWQPAFGKIIVSTPAAPATNFFAGQNVEISGVIAPPPLPLAKGLFDYRDYLKTRGIYYELKTSSSNDWQLSAPALLTPPLSDRFLNWSRHTLAVGLPVEDEPLRLLWAMTLGWRTAFSGDIAQPFLQAGTIIQLVFP
jgi:hypothetical protein